MILGARPLQHALFAAAALGLIACATILGINDRNLDTQGSDASTEAATDASADVTTDMATAADSSKDTTTTSPDSTTDGSSGSDVSTGRDGAPDSAPGDGGSDGDASSIPDGSGPDGPTSDALAADAPGPDAPGPDGQSDAASCPDPCVLATGLNHPFSMTSDSARVYWTEFGDALGTANGSVRACPVAGCPASGPTAYALAQMNARGIAVDSQNVYWATATYGGVNGAIWSCPVNGASGGCSPMQLASAGIPFGVALDATYVYWVDYNDYTVHRVLKGGGTDNVLYDGGAGVTSSLQQCSVGGSHVYFTDNNAQVFDLPIGAGADPILIAIGSTGGTWPVTNDTNSVYYGQSGSVYREAKGSVGTGAVIAGGIADPDDLAIDPATNMIYWSDFGSTTANDGTVGKVGIDGGGKVILGASLVAPEAVTVSGNYVLWLSNGILDDAGLGSGATLPSTGALLRRAK